MTSHWFRFYDDAVDDPKVQRLPASLFKFWVNVLCLASRNNGKLPSMVDMEFSLRLSQKSILSSLETLKSFGLVDNMEEGMEPHNWNGRQFKADVSTARVRKFRERHVKRDETVSRNAPETETEQKEDTSLRSVAREPKPKFTPPSWVPEPQWTAFLEMRKKLHAPMTDHAMELTIAKLDGFRLKGHDLGAVLDQSVERGWKGVFEIKSEDSNGSGGYKNGKQNDRGRQAMRQGFAEFALGDDGGRDQEVGEPAVGAIAYLPGTRVA